jgi:hypothetical protein
MLWVCLVAVCGADRLETSGQNMETRRLFFGLFLGGFVSIGGLLRFHFVSNIGASFPISALRFQFVSILVSMRLLRFHFVPLWG